MSEGRLRAITLRDFSVVPIYAQGALTIRLSGAGDMSHAEELQKFLSTLHIEAQHLGVEEVVADCRNLEFLSSSCFKGFINWLAAVVSTTRYRVRFLSNPKHQWQRSNLFALSRFAPAHTIVEKV